MDYSENYSEFDKILNLLEKVKKDGVGKWKKSQYSESIYDSFAQKDVISVYTLPIPLYTEAVGELISGIYEFDLEHPEYNLSCYKKLLEERENVDISDMDAQGIMTLLMNMARMERFCDGYIMEKFNSGDIEKCRIRLHEIIAEQRLYDFLRGVSPFSIYDCINAPYQWLERTHNYIQWCFPNRTPSSVVKYAPVLTDAIVDKILNSETCLHNIKSMTDQMIQFYEQHPVRSSFDHNCKRITRILLFLYEIDRTECERFYKTVAEKFIAEYGTTPILHNVIGINTETIRCWVMARAGVSAYERNR